MTKGEESKKCPECNWPMESEYIASGEWWDQQSIEVFTEQDCMYECYIVPTVQIYRESYEEVEDYASFGMSLSPPVYRPMFTEAIAVTAKPKWYGRA